MINTDIRSFIDIKNKEHIELQKILFESSLSNVNVVYQKFNYTSKFLINKIKKVELQIKGAINIVEKVEENKWNLLNLSFIENLAKEEFIYHIAIDSKYYNILSEKLIEKIIFSLQENDDINANLNRLKNLKNKLMFNLRRYGDLDYKKDWIRDRYFELASFMEFDKNLEVINNNCLTTNSIYDIVISGEKTVNDMERGGIHYDVLKVGFKNIKDAASKDVLYLMNDRKGKVLQ